MRFNNGQMRSQLFELVSGILPPSHGPQRLPVAFAFGLICHVSFAVGTPDQLALATVLTVYCLAVPIRKERGFSKRYGLWFDDNRERVPYAVPRLRNGAAEPVTPKGSRHR